MLYLFGVALPSPSRRAPRCPRRCELRHRAACLPSGPMMRSAGPVRIVSGSEKHRGRFPVASWCVRLDHPANPGVRSLSSLGDPADQSATASPLPHSESLMTLQVPHVSLERTHAEPLARPRVATEQFAYDDAIVRKFLTVTLVWGLVAFLAGLIIALELVAPRAAQWEVSGMRRNDPPTGKSLRWTTSSSPSRSTQQPTGYRSSEPTATTPSAEFGPPRGGRFSDPCRRWPVVNLRPSLDTDSKTKPARLLAGPVISSE